MGRKEQEQKGREARGGRLLLHLCLAMPLVSCNVCHFMIRGAGLCYSCIFNPKTLTVSQLVTCKQAWPQASHQLNPAPSSTHFV